MDTEVLTEKVMFSDIYQNRNSNNQIIFKIYKKLKYFETKIKLNQALKFNYFKLKAVEKSLSKKSLITIQFTAFLAISPRDRHQYRSLESRYGPTLDWCRSKHVRAGPVTVPRRDRKKRCTFLKLNCK